MRLYKFLISLFSHSRPQRPRSFWSAPRIATSGQVQRHSGFEWICKHNRLRPEPIRFVRLDSEHAQSDGKSLNRGLPLLDMVSILGADQKERGLWGRECCSLTLLYAELSKFRPEKSHSRDQKGTVAEMWRVSH